MRRNNVSYAKYGYIFSIPFIIAFILFLLYPLAYTTVIGFTDLRGMGATEWNIMENPFDNFISVLNNNTFRVSLSNTFRIWIANFIPQMLLALLLTAWFTTRRHKFKGMGAFKILFYMPNIITAATIAILFNVFFQFPGGPINEILVALGLREEPFNFLISGVASRLIIAFIQFWMWYGYTMLILISGVLGQNPAMYEAADIDGASGVQTFFLITIPNLKTILLFIIVTSIVGGLNMFDIPRLFNEGMPDNGTSTVALFIFNQAFAGRFLFNTAAAASMIVFVIIVIVSLPIFFLLRDKDVARERKERKALNKSLKKTGGARQ
jgi:multiple sugar transport system permease protein